MGDSANAPTLKQVFVRPRTLFVNRMPHSEVCVHMRIAGKDMACEIISPRSVQLYSLEDVKRNPFSSPVLLSEAGVYTDGSGQFYIYREVRE